MTTTISLHPADLALHRLLDGNQHFISNQALHPHQSIERCKEIAQGQEPFAMLLGCADSRVSPECIFDCGLGDLFVIRTAGQAIDHAALGSLEFGVVELHIPLLIVLGHEKCGAVIATLEALENDSPVEGDVQFLIDAIRPAVELAKAKPGDLIENSVEAHIHLTIGRLFRSPVLARAVQNGDLKIVGAKYALKTGLVELIPA